MDPTPRESILRAALARIAGLTDDDVQRGAVGVLASILSEVNETAERALATTAGAARTAEPSSEVRTAAELEQWITKNHVRKRDSDVVDTDHGPIVEWEYCDWCFDHGLPEDWPCMFVKALAATDRVEGT